LNQIGELKKGSGNCGKMAVTDGWRRGRLDLWGDRHKRGTETKFAVYREKPNVGQVTFTFRNPIWGALEKRSGGGTNYRESGHERR